MENRARGARRLGVLAALLLGACQSTEVEGIRVDESFTHAALKEGKLALGGVTSARTVLPDPDRSRLAEGLSRKIVDERGEVEVVSAGAVRHRLGPEAYAGMLEEYRTDAALSPSRLEALRVLEDTARYLLLARIEADDVSHDDETKKGTGDDEGYRIRTVSTHRRAIVGLRVYDLRTGASVWNGATRAERLASSEIERERLREDDEERFWVAVADAVLDDDEPPPPPPFPPAPALDPLLFESFAKFARSLPAAEE